MTTSKTKSKKSQRILAVLLIAALAITGAFAFLTATTDTKVNKFTVGSITVELDEGPWEELPDTDDDNIPDEAENLVSGKIIEKAPSIINTGANEAYGFIVLSVPKADVVVTDSEGFKSASAVNELFTLHTTSAAGVNTADWTLVESDTTTSDEVNYYVYSYNTTIGAGVQTSTLFDKVQFAYVTEDFAGDTEMTLTIDATAVAIQADEEITSAQTAWATLKADEAFKGASIYPIA